MELYRLLLAVEAFLLVLTTYDETLLPQRRERIYVLEYLNRSYW